MTKKDDSCWLGFDGFGAIHEHHQIIELLLGAYVGITTPYDLLGVEELLKNGGRRSNTITELLWNE